MRYQATVSHREPALFRRFPALRQTLPQHAFLDGPTPVLRLDLCGIPGIPGGLFAKDDSATCALYGGNKPRKLEFVIGKALAQGNRRLLTSGGLGTHHGLATTVLGREVGLSTTLVLVDQPVTEAVRASLRGFAAYGADVIDARHVPGAVARGALAWLAARARGERPLLVPTGGSSPLGNLGLVSAALELAEQIRSGVAPEPAEIYVAVGTGGTLVGLTLGLHLAGLECRVVGVLVTDILPPSPIQLRRAARRTHALLRRADPKVPRGSFRATDFVLVPGQLGPGYGASTPAAETALQRAAEAGMRLETTYTAKCLAEILDRAERGTLKAGPVLFWNTFNGIDVLGRAPKEGHRALPSRLARIARTHQGAAAVPLDPEQRA